MKIVGPYLQTHRFIAAICACLKVPAENLLKKMFNLFLSWSLTQRYLNMFKFSIKSGKLSRFQQKSLRLITAYIFLLPRSPYNLKFSTPAANYNITGELKWKSILLNITNQICNYCLDQNLDFHHIPDGRGQNSCYHTKDLLQVASLL